MMRRWTRSMPESGSVYHMSDVHSMQRTLWGGEIIFGKDDEKLALKFACVTLKPTNIFQLTLLNKYLMNFYSNLNHDSEFSARFRWAAMPLRRLESDYLYEQDYKKGVFFWSDSCERGWRALQFAILNPWDAINTPFDEAAAVYDACYGDEEEMYGPHCP